MRVLVPAVAGPVARVAIGEEVEARIDDVEGIVPAIIAAGMTDDGDEAVIARL